MSSTAAPRSATLGATNAASVRLLSAPPAADYVTVGEIRVQLKGITSRAAVAEDRAIQAAIRAEAARLGGDAVIEIHVINRTGAVGARCCGGGGLVPAYVRATAIRLNATSAGA